MNDNCLGMSTRSQNQGFIGQPGVIKNILHILVSLLPWAIGQWEGRGMQPDFSMECLGCLLPELEGLELERQRHFVQAGLKQVHLRTLRDFANLFEDLGRAGPLC